MSIKKRNLIIKQNIIHENWRVPSCSSSKNSSTNVASSGRYLFLWSYRTTLVWNTPTTRLKRRFEIFASYFASNFILNVSSSKIGRPLLPSRWIVHGVVVLPQIPCNFWFNWSDDEFCFSFKLARSVEILFFFVFTSLFFLRYRCLDGASFTESTDGWIYRLMDLFVT